MFLTIIIFRHSPSSTQKGTTSKVLADYSDSDARVELTIAGRLQGDDVRRSITIAVDRYARMISIFQGYQGNILKSESFVNNQDAYRAFLAAMSNEGFSLKRNLKNPKEDGTCPLGLHYNYDFISNDGHDSHLWSSSCSAGTMAGQRGIIQTLFRSQITDYDRFTSDVQL